MPCVAVLHSPPCSKTTAHAAPCPVTIATRGTEGTPSGPRTEPAPARQSGAMHQLFRLVLGQRDLSRAGDLFSLEDAEIEDSLSEALEEIKAISCHPVWTPPPTNSHQTPVHSTCLHFPHCSFPACLIQLRYTAVSQHALFS